MLTISGSNSSVDFTLFAVRFIPRHLDEVFALLIIKLIEENIINIKFKQA